MAAVMSAPPPLPDRRDRPPPPPIASMPSRNRPTSLKTGTTNSKRPLPPPPTSNGDLSSRLSTPDQRSRKHSDNYDSRAVLSPADRAPTKTSNTLPRVHTAPSFDAPPPLPPRRAETMRPSHGVSSRVVTSHEKPSKDILSYCVRKIS